RGARQRLVAGVRSAGGAPALTSRPGVRQGGPASGGDDMKRALILAVAFCCCAAVQAADLRPITHEDVWLAKRIGDPVPSPDGRWVVFTVAEPAYADEDRLSDLWLVPADGSAPARRLTNSRGGESDVAWSEDSQRI